MLDFAPGAPGPWLILPAALGPLRAALAQALAHLPGPPAPGSPAGYAPPPPQPSAPAIALREGVAIVPVRGPLYPAGTPLNDMLAAVLGGTNSHRLAALLDALAAEPRARAILLDVDSPGGPVHGTADLADAVARAAASKPLWAYAGGDMASGAYWVGSAASRVVASPTARLGSIGVISPVYDDTARLEKDGIRRDYVTSALSPYKWADPFTEQGRLLLQEQVDDLAAEFVAAVARNRHADEATVLSDYGGGDVLVGAEAVAAGLADATGTLHSTLAELAAAVRPASRPAPGPALAIRRPSPGARRVAITRRS